MQRTTATTITLANRITVGELQAALEDLPPNGQVRFTVYPGDQRDPSYTTLTVTH